MTSRTDNILFYAFFMGIFEKLLQVIQNYAEGNSGWNEMHAFKTAKFHKCLGYLCTIPKQIDLSNIFK